MSDEAEPVRVWCKGCSAVFVAFLQKIADHNAKLVCPNCGTINTVPDRIAQASIQGKFHEGSRAGGSNPPENVPELCAVDRAAKLRK